MVETFDVRTVHRRRPALLVGSVLLADIAALGHSHIVRIVTGIGALIALIIWLGNHLLARHQLVERIHRAW